jgi:hypothetical protein
MKTKLLGLIASIALLGASSVGAAKADTITSFEVVGTFSYVTGFPPLTGPVPLSGTITVDTTTADAAYGQVIAADLKVSTLDEFNIAPERFFGVGIVGLNVYDSTGLDLVVTFIASPNPDSLVGFTGGTFNFGAVTIGHISLEDLSGTISPTPLPAALPLFATGLGALGLLGWRRKRKAQAAA